MANDLGLSEVREPLERLAELLLLVLDEVLHVVVRAPEALLCYAGAPDEPIEHHAQERGRIHTEPVHQLGMASKERVTSSRMLLRPQKAKFRPIRKR